MGAAPNLAALRNVIGDLFEAVHLVRSGERVVEVQERMGEGFIPWHHDVPTLADGEQATGCCSNYAPQPWTPRR